MKKSKQKTNCGNTGAEDGGSKESVEAPAAVPEVKSLYDREADSHGFVVFMRRGGWCWFQDPRAILHDGKLFIGSVHGNDKGPARVGVYDLDRRTPLGSATLREAFDRDDHNAPVFFVRPDGRVLTVYARHHKDTSHYLRMSDPRNPLKWSEETEVPAGDRVTYANLIYMKDEGNLYNFYRGINFNPTFTTSGDYGTTWSGATHFIASELEGTHRPYPRYGGNGKDTVYVSFTDGHPRNFGNSVYYAEFRNGTFWKADGTRIKELAEEGPLRPSEAEEVYGGGGGTGVTADLSVPRSAWTSSIAVDSKGYPHIGYTLYLSNRDHRYRLASWDGRRWHDREVAFGGGCLYELESSYTGLIELDPVDPGHVVISTDVNPATGEATGGRHEIYRAKIGLKDDVSTIGWEAVTRDSPVDNIRPMVLREGGRRVVLWQRGEYQTFKNYDVDTVGLLEDAAP